jgi:quinol monooxygenase YgiN
MWTLRDPADGAGFKAELDSCRNLVPGLLGFEVALRPAPALAALGAEANVDVVMVATFTDAEALAAYQKHPHHKAVSGRLSGLRLTRHVMDYTLHE